DFASEGFAELVEVLDSAVGAPLAAGVRIGLGAQPCYLLRLVFAPYLTEAEEESLCRRVSINLLRWINAVFGECFLECGECDVQATVVGGVFAECQLTVQRL